MYIRQVTRPIITWRAPVPGTSVESHPRYYDDSSSFWVNAGWLLASFLTRKPVTSAAIARANQAKDLAGVEGLSKRMGRRSKDRNRKSENVSNVGNFGDKTPGDPLVFIPVRSWNAIMDILDFFFLSFIGTTIADIPFELQFIFLDSILSSTAIDSIRNRRDRIWKDIGRLEKDRRGDGMGQMRDIFYPHLQTRCYLIVRALITRVNATRAKDNKAEQTHSIRSLQIRIQKQRDSAPEIPRSKDIFFP